ncbi:MAG: acyl-CoA thioesterase [Clostridia bacterium]|nr:acyl-CoA thioesterase [Clostridia bacterium]
MKIYEHKVKYYETDKMGIVHHSNYIRWMESARMDLFEQMGFPFARLEEMGAISPVVSVSCEYKSPTKFDDKIGIKVEVEEFKGVRLFLKYTVFNAETNVTAAIGHSSHCFVDSDNKPVVLKKHFPEFDAALRNLLCYNATD